jgi:ribosome biogenesis protein MAK21
MGQEAPTGSEKPAMESLSLIRFLDKFSYRNPKEKEVPKGGSIMQPLLARHSASDVWLRSKKPHSSRQASINSATFWSRRREDVAADDVFFHEYFSRSGKAVRAAKKTQAASDAGSVREWAEEEGEEDDDHDGWDALSAGAGEGAEGSDDEDLQALMKEMDDSESDIEIDGSDRDNELDEGGGEGEEEGLRGAGEVLGSSGRTAKPKKRRLGHLPTFASADDYAHLLEEGLVPDSPGRGR